MSDADIRRLVQRAGRDVPADQWFVKKTLNRLPPRRRPLLGLADIVTCLFVLAFFALCFVTPVKDEAGAEMVTPLERVTVFLSAALGLTLYMGALVLRRCRL